MEKENIKGQIFTKRADNVKIVIGPGGKPIYICPYPKTHYQDVFDEQRKRKLRKIGPDLIKNMGV